MRTVHCLEVEDYDRVRPIFSELADIHLHIVAVLDGTCPGEVYVDDVACPRAAYIASSGVFYLAGTPGNRGFNTALNAVLPRDTYFVLFCNPELWEDALDVVLKDTYAVRAARRYYTLDRVQVAGWRGLVPEGYTMRRVDADLLAEDLENRDHVVDGILDGWRSVDLFLEQGFGFCLVHDAQVVSWSLSDYVRGDRCEMGINTAWECRRQGFGTLTAVANAAHAAARGFSTVGWHCWDNNVGSIGVARNVGFQKTADYDVFINHWAAENITDMTHNEFRAFAEFYERQFEAHPPASGFPYIVAAKARALGQDRQGCFKHLNKAVDLGWLRGVDHLGEIWPEFFWNPELDQMEEWLALVERFDAGSQT